MTNKALKKLRLTLEDTWFEVGMTLDLFSRVRQCISITLMFTPRFERTVNYPTLQHSKEVDSLNMEMLN